MMGAGSTALLLVVVAALTGLASAGDNVHQDDDAPKIPGCSNDFMLVRASNPQSSAISPRVSYVFQIGRASCRERVSSPV